MKKIFYSLIIFLTFIFAGCSKDSDPLVPQNDNEDITSSTGSTNYAPKKIIGKSLTLYTSSGKVTNSASEFNSDGNCDVEMMSYLYSLTGTPVYSYRKLSDNTAYYTLNYSEKFTLEKNSYLDVSFTVSLTFTSVSSGKYTGTEKSVSSATGTSSRTIAGTFVLY